MQTRSRHVILGFILLVIVLVMMDQAVGKKAIPNKQKPIVTKTKTATQTATSTTNKNPSDASSLRITQLENQVASLRNELKQTQENFRKNKDEMVKIVYSLIEIVKGKNKSASPSSAPEATVETKNQPTVPSAKPEQKATTPSTNVKPAEKKVDSKKAKKTKKELDDLDDFDI